LGKIIRVEREGKGKMAGRTVREPGNLSKAEKNSQVSCLALYWKGGKSRFEKGAEKKESPFRNRSRRRVRNLPFPDVKRFPK